LNADDVAAIASAMDAYYRPMVWLGAVLGLRWSEVAGIRVGRVDFLQRTVTVAETVTRDGKGRPVLSFPKSAAGSRTLAIPPALVDILAKHMATYGLTVADKGRFLFEEPGQLPLRYPNWRRSIWIPAAAAAGHAGAGFHDLRRASATALVNRGIDLKTAQVRLGHSDPRLTLQVYAEVVQESEQRAAASLGDHFLPGKPRRVADSY
jgi:integrase